MPRFELEGNHGGICSRLINKEKRIKSSGYLSPSAKCLKLISSVYLTFKKQAAKEEIRATFPKAKVKSKNPEWMEGACALDCGPKEFPEPLEKTKGFNGRPSHRSGKSIFYYKQLIETFGQK